MIQAIWTLIKLLLVAGVVIFLMEQEGTFRIEWQDYVISAHLGMVLVALTLFLVIILFFHKIILHLTSVPKYMRAYWQDRSLRKGHTAITKSLVALAAGDHKHAAYHAHRAQKLLPDEYDNGVATFLEAQAARYMGQHKRATTKFNTLLENRESAFLGIRGLMQTEIEAQNYKQALDMAYSADRMHPKQSWILKTIYDLELQTHQWSKVLATLKKLEKLKAIDKETALKDRKAIHVVLADQALGARDIDEAKHHLKKALTIDAGFVPACTRLVDIAIEAGQKRKAKSLIERTWKLSPHPDLIKFWDILAPENTPKKPTARLSWYESLTTLNPNAASGYMALAQIAIDDGLWGEARAFLTKAENLDNHAGVYLAWAELERLSTQNDEAVHAWMKKSQTAKRPKCWVCQTTNHIYETWYAIAEPYGLFNTIEWAYPNKKEVKAKYQSLSTKETTEDLLLSAPSGLNHPKNA
ncbi:MAG: heme biosynthesis protein HemY [Bdellovibrionales bacterium]